MVQDFIYYSTTFVEFCNSVIVENCVLYWRTFWNIKNVSGVGCCVISSNKPSFSVSRDLSATSLWKFTKSLLYLLQLARCFIFWLAVPVKRGMYSIMIMLLSLPQPQKLTRLSNRVLTSSIHTRLFQSWRCDVLCASAPCLNLVFYHTEFWVIGSNPTATVQNRKFLMIPIKTN